MTRSRPVKHLESALEIGLVFEQVQARVVRARCNPRAFATFCRLRREFGIEREQIVRLPELLRFENLFFASRSDARRVRATVGLRPSLTDSFSIARLTREIEFLQAARNLDRPSFVAEIALDLADDRRRRIRREFDAAFEIEAVDRLEQTRPFRPE